MEVANCMVALSGSMLSIVPKRDVTPAEALVLLAIHGEGSVKRLERTTNDKRSHREEVDRLKSIYRDDVIASMFPGLNPQLPVTFKDAGLEIENDITAKARASRKGRNDVPQHDGEGVEDVAAEAAEAVAKKEPEKAPEAPADDGLEVPEFLKRSKGAEQAAAS